MQGRFTEPAVWRMLAHNLEIWELSQRGHEKTKPLSATQLAERAQVQQLLEVSWDKKCALFFFSRAAWWDQATGGTWRAVASARTEPAESLSSTAWQGQDENRKWSRRGIGAQNCDCAQTQTVTRFCT